MSFDLVFWAGKSELTPAATWHALAHTSIEDGSAPSGLRPVRSLLVLRALRSAFSCSTPEEIELQQKGDTITVKGRGWRFELVGESSSFVQLSTSMSFANTPDGNKEIERVVGALTGTPDLTCYDPQTDLVFPEPVDPTLDTLPMT